MLLWPHRPLPYPRSKDTENLPVHIFVPLYTSKIKLKNVSHPRRELRVHKGILALYQYLHPRRVRHD